MHTYIVRSFVIPLRPNVAKRDMLNASKTPFWDSRCMRDSEKRYMLRTKRRIKKIRNDGEKRRAVVVFLCRMGWFECRLLVLNGLSISKNRRVSCALIGATER